MTGLLPLAIDPATSTGYACGKRSGVVCFAPKGHFHPTERHARIFSRYSEWLCGCLDVWQPSVVVIEGMVGRGLKGAAAQILLGIRATTLVVAWRREIIVDEVTDGTWKKWAKPRGWVKGDEADAVFMRDYWLAERAETVGAA